MTATVKVLNGEVSVGDTIAYSTRSGSSHEMTIAEVVEIPAGFPCLKVRMVEATDSKWRAHPKQILTLTVLDRVVKLGTDQAGTSPELAAHVEWLKTFGVQFEQLVTEANDAGDEKVMYAAAGALSLLQMCVERLTEVAGE